MKNNIPLSIQNAQAEVFFNDLGDVTQWTAGGAPAVMDRPIRQNTRVDFKGIQIWTKSGSLDEQDELMPIVEYEYQTEIVCADDKKLVVLRRGTGWKLQITWRLQKAELHLDCALTCDSADRRFQIELLCFAPYHETALRTVRGTKDGKSWSHTLPIFGRAQAYILDRGSRVEFASETGQTLTLDAREPKAWSHVYHRGFSLKLGSASAIAAQGETVEFNVVFRSQKGEPLQKPVSQINTEIDWSRFAKKDRKYKAGLMLHLQYTPLPNIESLLEKWVELSGLLGFDFMLFELNRGIRVHPAAPPHALSLDTLARIVRAANARGMEIRPMYNLLGHQSETGLLDWHPDWRETDLDGLCVSNPEVRKFAADLICQLEDAFRSGWVHIGGDELKLPTQAASRRCPLCGPSPNMEAIIDYWNELQSGAPENVRLAVWSDQLIPASKVLKGLTAYGSETRGVEFLQKLDRTIKIVNWQYSALDPTSALEFLAQFGHMQVLASGQYKAENPYIHARLCRAGLAQGALHTVWSSPHPQDCPLESVAAAAMAHAGEPFDPEKTPAECTAMAEKLARWLGR